MYWDMKYKVLKKGAFTARFLLISLMIVSIHGISSLQFPFLFSVSLYTVPHQYSGLGYHVQTSCMQCLLFSKHGEGPKIMSTPDGD